MTSIKYSYLIDFNHTDLFGNQNTGKKMTVYIVSRLTIHDRSKYDEYESGFAEIFEKYDGKMLSVDEEPTVLAGKWEATRSVIIEFPSKKSALTWLMSDEYQGISKARDAGSTASSILVKGLE